MTDNKFHSEIVVCIIGLIVLDETDLRAAIRRE